MATGIIIILTKLPIILLNGIISFPSQISLGSVSNIEEAVQWLRYTFLFVRMRLNPLIYGISNKTREVRTCRLHT